MTLTGYSDLKATIGLTAAALLAGYTPEARQRITEKSRTDMATTQRSRSRVSRGRTQNPFLAVSHTGIDRVGVQVDIDKLHSGLAMSVSVCLWSK